MRLTLELLLFRLGELLLGILRAAHPKISRLNAVLLDIKNKVLEVFMFIPAWLLTAFIERQQLREAEQSQHQDPFQVPILQALVQHLQTMLLITRVEKIRLVVASTFFRSHMPRFR